MLPLDFFCSVPVCAVSCCSSADWQTKVLEFNLLRASFFFPFFVEPVMNDTMEGRFPFCHNKKFCTDGSDAWRWVRPLTECNCRGKIAASKLGIYHSYQYKQSLTAEVAHKVTLSCTFLTFCKETNSQYDGLLRLLNLMYFLQSQIQWFLFDCTKYSCVWCFADRLCWTWFQVTVRAASHSLDRDRH